MALTLDSHVNAQTHICTSNALHHAAVGHTACVTHFTASVFGLYVALHTVHGDSRSLLFLSSAYCLMQAELAWSVVHESTKNQVRWLKARC